MEESKLKKNNATLREAMKLYLVSDRQWLQEPLREAIAKSLEGGVTCVQVREKDMPHEAFVEEVQQIQALCKQQDILCIVNDDIDVMLEANADGIHVGQHDLNAQQVRQRIGNDKILGVSVQTVQQALQAEKEGADYLGVGAMFSTDTKKDADAVSYDTLQAICKAVHIPVVAIGGIHLQNISQLKGSGIAGIAVVSAIMAQTNIKEAAMQLLAEVKCL